MSERGQRLRVLWVCDRLDLAAIEGIAARHDLYVLAGDAPPGRAELRVGAATLWVEGVDWIWRKMPGRQLQRGLCTLAGWPSQAVHLRERDRELARAAAALASPAHVDLVHVENPAVVVRMPAVSVPIVADLGIDQPAASASSSPLRDFAGSLDRWAASRLRRRATARAAAVVPDVGSRERVWRQVAPDEAGTSPEQPCEAAPVTGRVLSSTIVVPTVGRGDLIVRSVGAVAVAAERVPGAEVLVVDQSGGGAESILRDAGIDARVIRDDRRGASCARNLGASTGVGDVVLYTDDDCIVPPRWVEDHLSAFRAEDVVATFGPVSGLSRSNDDVDDPAELRRHHRRGNLPWHIGHGSNMAVRRTALLDAGGWDERLGPGTDHPAGEDAELIVRLLSAGDVVSGVGAPVLHIPWRSAEEDRRNLDAYEIGAGTWIGMHLRARSGDGVAFLRARVRLLRMRSRSGAAGPVAVALSAARLGHGLLQGVRLGLRPSAGRDRGVLC